VSDLGAQRIDRIAPLVLGRDGCPITRAGAGAGGASSPGRDQPDGEADSHDDNTIDGDPGRQHEK
jgi:hypothetical protein